LKCLFIGPLANHAVIGRVAAFSAAGFEMYLVDGASNDIEWLRKGYPVPGAKIVDSLKDPFFRNIGLISHLLEGLRILALIPEDRGIISRIHQLSDAISPDFVVTHYGPYAIHFARIWKRVKPFLPVINIVNVLPAAVNFYPGILRHLRGCSGFIEKLNYRYWLKQIDAVFYANRFMYEYAQQKYVINPDKSFIIPDFLPKFFFNNDLDAPCQNSGTEGGNPKVIFLGAPERFGTIIDAIDDHFLELAKHRIHIYAGAMSEKVISTGFGHLYPRFSNKEVFEGKLASYASSFDAAIVAYNVPRKQERFRTTFPTRLFMAIAAGLPIAVRGGILDACELFVKKHDIGFVYNSPSDLREILMNNAETTRMRRQLNMLRQSMTAESQADQISAIVAKLVSLENAPLIC